MHSYIFLFRLENSEVKKEMYSIIYSIYYRLKRIEKKRKEQKIPPSKVVSFLLGYVEWFYNVPVRKWYEKHPSNVCGINKKERKQQVIVSFTSHPQRIEYAWITVETLLRQSYKPDQLVLWLASSQFAGLEDLPISLTNLQKRGLTIRFCDDLRSHKKYYYALQDYPEALVILADDDMFYPKDTVKKLLKMHKKWPEDICCITAQVITPDFYAMPSSWRNPKLDERHLQHTDILQAFTGSGTLIPPRALPKETFDQGTFQKICPYADDLWIAFMAHRKGTKITTMRTWRPFPVCIYGTSAGSLYYINGEGKQNDAQWKKMLDHYKASNK